MPFIKVDPAGSYLSDPSSNDFVPPTRANATDFGVTPGQILSFRASGDYAAGQGWDEEENEILAVFVDAEGNYLAPDLHPNAVTEVQSSGLATDIPQDFPLSIGDIVHIRVPDSAVALLFSVEDSYYSDNTDPDGDLGVTVSVTDGMLSGMNAILWLKSIYESNIDNDNSNDAFEFFEFIDWASFLAEPWGSSLYLSSDNDSYSVTSPSGGAIRFVSSSVDGATSGNDQTSVYIRDSAGNTLDWSISSDSSWGSNSETNEFSGEFSYSKVGSSSTDADDIHITYSFDVTNRQAWGPDFDSGSETKTRSFELTQGNSESGVHYSIENLVESGEWSWSPQLETDSFQAQLTNLLLEDFGLGSRLAFSVNVSSTDNGKSQLFTFRNFEDTWQGKSYAKDIFQVEVGADEFDVDLSDYKDVIRFYRAELVDQIKDYEVTSSPSPSSPGTTTTGSITNITNVTNVTNNISNTTNVTNNVINNNTTVTGNNNTVSGGDTTTNSGNTTNNNSGNTTNNTTTNVDIGTLNNIRNFDASVTNDSSVKQTVLGNITNYEGSVANNVLVGSDGVDQLLGLAGNDRFYSSKGNDTYDGGEGLDGITFNGSRSNFKLSKSGGNWVIQDLRDGDANEGTDTLIGVERLGFGDEAVALDFDPGDSSYSTVLMIGAAFGKALVPTYFGVGVELFDQGATSAEIAQTIADLKLIESTIGTEDTTAWINHVYKNLVGVEPDPLSLGLVSNLLETGAYTRASLLEFAAGLPLLEAQVDMTGLQTDGLTYTPFL